MVDTNWFKYANSIHLFESEYLNQGNLERRNNIDLYTHIEYGRKGAR